MVPINLFLTVKFPTKLLDPYLGAGPQLGISHVTVSLDGARLRRTDVDWGGSFLVGIEKYLGVGFLFLEVSYTYSSKSKTIIETDPGGLTVDLGYRFRLW